MCAARADWVLKSRDRRVALVGVTAQRGGGRQISCLGRILYLTVHRSLDLLARLWVSWEVGGLWLRVGMSSLQRVLAITFVYCNS